MSEWMRKRPHVSVAMRINGAAITTGSADKEIASRARRETIQTVGGPRERCSPPVPDRGAGERMMTADLSSSVSDAAWLATTGRSLESDRAEQMAHNPCSWAFRSDATHWVAETVRGQAATAAASSCSSPCR